MFWPLSTHNRTVFNNYSDKHLTAQKRSDIENFDREHLWHPYSPLPGVDSWVVSTADGPYLYISQKDYEPTRVIDAMSSWWAAAHGYRHPRLNAAAQKQIDNFSHVMFGGLTHAPAVELGEKLLALTPAELEAIFYCDSGSVSVEVAVKIALQYWKAHEDPKLHQKTRLLTWRSGYHGDTFTPMSVCDPEGGMHSLWEGVVRKQIFLPPPPADSSCSLMGAPGEFADSSADEDFKEYLDEVRAILHDRSDEIAALIIEPVVQGAGGMRFHRPELVQKVVELCREHNVLIIFDEIATGFGRTGPMFALEECGVTPDIMCIGKALTGGYLTSAAVLTTKHIGETISSGTGALMHGPTFMGNPLACAIGSAAVDLAMEAVDEKRSVMIEKLLRKYLAPAAELPGVSDIRVKGAIGVVEMKEPVDMVAATRAAIEQGVWIRPFGRLIYCMPPFICDEKQVKTICDGMIAAASTSGNRQSDE
ncbi:MAG TPA: adenosylmethionine--8-amino-7-oxononanoate transaminase [Corynebacteriales bacterium]|nr:adenosylmethionine--8-amino-7-oxononanoate transaminase [Mycobacteriales bacterium]